MRSAVLPVCLVLLAGLFADRALAQDSLSDVDVHGFVHPFGAGRADVPLSGFRAAGLDQWEMAAGLVFEASGATVFQSVVTNPDEAPERTALLRRYVGTNLAASVGLHRRITVGFTLPVAFVVAGQFEGGVEQRRGLGDLHLWVPINLVHPGEGATKFGFDVVPYVRFPTGAKRALLSDTYPAGGALAALSLSRGLFSADLNTGIGTRLHDTDASANLKPGLTLRGGASVGITPVDMLSVHAEVAVESRLTPSVVQLEDGTVQRGTPWSGTPIEAYGVVRGRHRSGFWYAAGFGRALSPGAGAAAWRVYLGAGYSLERPDPGLEIVENDLPYLLHVVAPDGAIIPGATIAVAGDTVATAGDDGNAEVLDLKWRKGVTVSAEGYTSATVGEPAEGTQEVTVTLGWLPSEVVLSVRDQTGNTVPATVVARSTNGQTQPAVGTPGLAKLELQPGTWEIEVTSAGFGDQVRGVVIPPRREGSYKAEAILLPEAGPAELELRVSDPDGAPVDRAVVQLAGHPVGTTANAGWVRIGGLAEGHQPLDVRAEAFEEMAAADQALVAGRNLVELQLVRAPGSVLIVAKTPSGEVTDASVRFLGPDRLGPFPLGEEGRRIFVFRPGTWQILVSSPQSGLQQRELVVPEGRYGLMVVEIVLQPSEEGGADLELRVVDAGGTPLEGVQVTLDEAEYGATASGGTLRVTGLRAGTRDLSLEGSYLEPAKSVPLLLVPGVQERTVEMHWVPGATEIRARTEAGPVSDATARFMGSGSVPSLGLGSDGVERLTLGTGSWQVLVSSPAAGLLQRGLTIAADDHLLHVVDAVMDPGEKGGGDLTVSVVDPDGNPVRGAAISLDGALLGSTGSDGTLAATSLREGTRTIEVSDPVFAPSSSSVKLKAGANSKVVMLAWAPGATRIKVLSAAGPVTDALVRLAGPAVVRATPVDDVGAVLMALQPGTWQALVSSPTLGMHQRSFEVTGKTPGLNEVELLVAAPPAGRASLLVRVQDPDGKPIGGATVKTGEHVIGTTPPGGAVLVDDLDLGRIRVSAEAAHFARTEILGVDLVAGSNERILLLSFEPVKLQVSATSADGTPVDAEVRFGGPEDVPSLRLGSDGTEGAALRPGHWTVLASTSQLGVARAEIDLALGDVDRKVSLELVPTQLDVTAEQVKIREQVHFDTDRAVPRPESAAILDEVANTLLAQPELTRIEVQGHTDSEGDVAYNLELSQRRADAVRAELVKRGVAPERLLARGFGPTRPVADNGTEEGKAENRRVQFDIVEQVKREK